MQLKASAIEHDNSSADVKPEFIHQTHRGVHGTNLRQRGPLPEALVARFFDRELAVPIRAQPRRWTLADSHGHYVWWFKTIKIRTIGYDVNFRRQQRRHKGRITITTHLHFARGQRGTVLDKGRRDNGGTVRMIP